MAQVNDLLETIAYPGGVARQAPGDGGLVAVQQEADGLRQGRGRADHSRDDHRRPVVSAHGVDRNHQRLGQGGALVLRRVPPDSAATLAPKAGKANNALSVQPSSPFSFFSTAKGDSGSGGGV